MKNNDPIWVIGTHRSGTTLVSQIVEEMGVFMGWRKDSNNESLFFVHRNEEILRASGGAWDRPESFSEVIRQHELTQFYIQRLARDWNGLPSLDFWGPKRASKAKSGLWGWKDPRMSIVAPLWVDIFDKPKIIRIIRNGVDVALSLQVREQKVLRGELKISRKTSLLPPFYRRPVMSVRCLTIEGAFDLWETYMAWEERLLSGGNLPTYTVRYEDILTDPVRHIFGLAEFIGVKPTDSPIERIQVSLRQNRRFAFLENEDSQKFYDKVRRRPFMQRYGYSNLSR
ncbi:MAG: hypothetical protein Kow0099_29870 [Candidatus Abyssubacteria bacterium]